jgi:short-subunit dehydrogenase
MKRMNLSGRWLILTGASSGLGREMAVVLARDHKTNLVLVARREDRLQKLATMLRERHGTEAEVLPADLSVTAEAERVFRTATEAHPLYGAVLNAGVTHFGRYDELPWDGFMNMLNLNVTSQVRLTTLLLPYLEQRGEHGGLLIVSSMTGLAPFAYQTAYSATKSFLLAFGCGLCLEMEPRGVSVTTYAPGGIATEMVAGKRFDSLRSWLMPADECAVEGIDAFVKRRYLKIPGQLNRIGAVLMRLLPQKLVADTYAAQYKRALDRDAG